ncbi:MAG: hypothetical protein II885_03540 [Oscillospiraceae bacterium]|nr:hypothetical protein [Oscillospiraceae bacterium]
MALDTFPRATEHAPPSRKRKTDCHTSDVGHWFAMTDVTVFASWELRQQPSPLSLRASAHTGAAIRIFMPGEHCPFGSPRACLNNPLTRLSGGVFRHSSFLNLEIHKGFLRFRASIGEKSARKSMQVDYSNKP